jgi:hypothetical protein
VEVREEVGGTEVRKEVEELAQRWILQAVEELVRRRRRGVQAGIASPPPPSLSLSLSCCSIWGARA